MIYNNEKSTTRFKNQNLDLDIKKICKQLKHKSRIIFHYAIEPSKIMIKSMID